jgi:hypothetical protein
MTMSEPVQIQITLGSPVDQQLSAKVIESKLMLLIKLIQQIAPEFEIKFEDPAIAIAHEQLPRPEMPDLASYHGGLSVYIGPTGSSSGYAGQII